MGDELTVDLDDGMSYEDARAWFDRMAEEVGDWQGIPVPVENMSVRLHEKHPLRDLYAEQDPTRIEVYLGGPERVDDERIVNRWYDPAHNRDVVIFNRSDGRAFALTIRRAPDSSMDRLDLWLMTLGASDAWDLDAEVKAMEKLGEFLSPRQRRHYLLTGSFLETSPRSGLTYLFRRLRPTVALTGRWPWFRARLDDRMRCLAVLCLHPIGYYDRSWAGCLVPSDDVLAHLLMVRGDEAYFWRKANQHDPSAPEAGL